MIVNGKKVKLQEQNFEVDGEYIGQVMLTNDQQYILVQFQNVIKILQLKNLHKDDPFEFIELGKSFIIYFTSEKLISIVKQNDFHNLYLKIYQNINGFNL